MVLDLSRVEKESAKSQTTRRKKKPPPGLQKKAQAPQTARAAPPQIVHVEQKDLPYSWTRYETKDGKIFYCNGATSEVQWHPPDLDYTRGWNWDPSKEKDGGANSWAAW